MSRTPRTTPAVIQRTQETASILERRIAGMSLKDIAEQEGVTPQAISVRIQRTLAATRQEPAEELVKLELARLDEISAALWPTAMREPFDPGPFAESAAVHRFEREVLSQTRAVEQLLKIQERRSRLIGLDHAELRKTALAKRELTAEQGRIVASLVERIMARAGVPREQYGPIAAEEFRRIAAEQQPDLLAGEIEDEGDWDDEMD